MPKKSGTVRLFVPVTQETHGYLRKLAAKLGVKPNQTYGIAISYGARMLLKNFELQEQLSPEQLEAVSQFAEKFAGGKSGRAKIEADAENLMKAAETEQKPKPRPKRKKAT